MTNRSSVFLMGAVLAGIISAGADPLMLSELSDQRLIEKTISIPDLLAQKRSMMRTFGEDDSGAELLVKFQSLERVRVLKVGTAEVDAALSLLSRRSDVQFVEKNRRLTRQFSASDPLLGEQWHHDKVQSHKAWDLGTGSRDVTIAIVDYPFNLDHPDLAANAVNGWDVINEVPVFSGYDEHATFSAGMAAGVLNNGVGIAGAGNCSVLPINVSGYIADMDAAIRWAADHGVRVVNISWAGADSPVLNAAAEYLRAQTDGIVVMAGVNGSGFLDYTNQPYIVAVSMTDSSDVLRSHSGEHIDFSAPGWQVTSTTVSSYGVESGTSFSAPLVSGMLATLFSIDPTLTAEQALSALRHTVVDLGDPGWDQQFGWGRVDFYHAAWLVAAHSANPPTLTTAAAVVSGEEIVLSSEFHPGLTYTLFGKDFLSQTNWVEVVAAVQTNGVMLEYLVEIDPAGAEFFKVTGELSL